MKPQDRTRAIMLSALDAESKLVLIAIADHMDTQDGHAHPSEARIARLTSLYPRHLGADVANPRARW